MYNGVITTDQSWDQHITGLVAFDSCNMSLNIYLFKGFVLALTKMPIKVI